MLAVLLAVALVAEPESKTAEDVLARMGEHDAITRKVRHERGYTCTRKEVRLDVEVGRDGAMQFSEDERKEFDVWAEADGMHHRLVRKNDRPVRNAGRETPKVDLITALRSKFKVRLADPPKEWLAGAECWKLIFEPQDPVPSAKNHEEAGYYHTTGTAWVDPEGYFVRRIEAKLPKPFSRSIGTVYAIEATLEQDLVEGIPALRRSDVRFHYSHFWEEHQRSMIEYIDHRFEKPAPIVQTPLP